MLTAKKMEKNGPCLSCDLHKIGSNLFSKLPLAPFLCKKVGHWVDVWVGGWMDGWVSIKAGQRIAYSNQKCIPLRFFFWRDPLNYHYLLRYHLNHLLRKWLLFTQIRYGLSKELKKTVGFEHCLKMQKSGPEVIYNV